MSDHAIQRYRRWYAALLRLYARPFRERFGESMEQTFHDLLRERARNNRGLAFFTLWLFAETTAGIIRENAMLTMIGKKDIIQVALAAGFLLLIPLTAMQFSDEVVWSFADFVFAGVLLMGAGLAYKLTVKKAGGMAYRLAAGIAVAAALFLIWANLAVGLIGSENNPANLMYLGVLAVGLIGAALARFQPHAMARALFAMACAQALVAAIALIAGMHRDPGSSIAEIVNVNGFFVVLFVVSALLFRHAAQANEPAGA